ncbi:MULTISPECIES: hypothetical protein [unclassified Mesorhizobium]|nr:MULTISPECIES: hypothetical protein [unclassified Mesorhizobium]
MLGTTVSQSLKRHGLPPGGSVRFSCADTAEENICRAIAPPKGSALHPI